MTICMSKRISLFLMALAFAGASCLPCHSLWSQAAKVDDVKEYKTAKPAHREAENWWRDRHRAKKALKDRMEQVDLVFIGDSITHSFESTGKKIWQDYYGDQNVLNLGFSGDKTENVVWRLQDGAIDFISPKAFVVMIGTNNTGHNMDPAGDTAEGIKAILKVIQKKSPDSKILLLAIFPRDEKPRSPKRKRNEEINEIISKFSDGESVFYLDINKSFLDDEGILSKEIMPDLLHPNEKGYAIWAQAMDPKLKELLSN